MGTQDEIRYLKSLVSQLEDKISALEAKSGAPPPKKTPAQQLRTILMGPPGAGASLDRSSPILPSDTRFLLLLLASARQGYPGSPNPRRVLCLSSGYR